MDNAASRRFDFGIFVAGVRDHLVNAPWKLTFLLSLLKLRWRGRSPNKTAIVSFYMANISPRVVAAQAEAIKRFLPPGVDLLQLHTGFGHGRSVDLFLKIAPPYETIVLLDIDCIPVTAEALPKLIKDATAGYLVGAAQRANHIGNGDHLYAGPFLMSFSRATYQRLGRPSFKETRRGDVAEELTYAAEARAVPLRLLWPTDCEERKWHLAGDIYFGRNTTYENIFLHAFQIRLPEHQQAFLATVARVLGQS